MRSRAAAAAAVALLALALAAAPPAAQAGQVSATRTQFSGGLNSTDITFATCISSNNTTSFTLPWAANVSAASMYVYWGNYSNGSNVTGWVSADVGADGSVEENVTFASSAWMNLTALGFNRYLGNSNATSGNVTVPLLLESCPPAGGWDLRFYSVSIDYTTNVPSNTTAPVFSGPLRNETLKVNRSRTSDSYLPSYFYDADGDDLNYTVVKQTASDPGWSNVTVSVNASRLYYTSSNGWLGNLTFRVKATDPANQSAFSNNVTLKVLANQPPTLAYNLTDTDMLVNSSSGLFYLPGYFDDPDGASNQSGNGSMTYSVQKVTPSDPGWSNVSLYEQYRTLWANATNGWLGNLSFRVRATDDGGLWVDSNVVTLTIRPNAPPELSANITDLEMEMGGSAYFWLWGIFSDPDGDYLTYRIVKSDPNASGWSYLTFDDGNSSGYYYITHSGSWAGNVSLRIRATDSGGNSADSNVFKVFVRSSPEAILSIPAQSFLHGTTKFGAVNLTAHFRDLDGDPLSYFVLLQGSAGCVVGGGGNNSTNRSLAYNPIFFRLNGTALDIGSNDTLWTGSATYFVMAVDPTLRCAQSNDFLVTVTAPPNAAPNFTGPIPDIYLVQATTRTSAVNLANFFRDPDGDVLVYGIQRVNTTDPLWAHLTVLLNGSKVEVRSLDSAWSGDMRVIFYARDPRLQTTYSNEVIIHVLTQDVPPVFSGAIPDMTMEAGTVLAGALDAGASFTDPDGFPLSYSVEPELSGLPEVWFWLDFVFNGSRLDIVSRDDEGWIGQVCFVVRAEDVVGSTAVSNVACLTVTAPPNSAPIAMLPLPDLEVSAGNNTAALLNLSLYFTDDRYAQLLVFQILKGPEPGWATVQLAASGSTLDVWFLGPTPPATLTYRVLVTDLRGATLTSAQTTLTITERAGNLPPVLQGPSIILVPVGGSVVSALAASDPNHDSLRFSLEGLPAGLSAAVDGSTLVLTVTHSGRDDNVSGELRVIVEDGWGGRTVLIILVAAFEPARLPYIVLAAHAESDGTIWVNGTISLWSSPPGASNLVVEIRVGPATHVFVPLVDGAFSAMVGKNFAIGDHSVDVSVADGFGRTGHAHTLVTVLPPAGSLPALVAIAVNGAVASEVQSGIPLEFTLTAASPLGPEVTVSWLLDGIPVGSGRSIVLVLAPGLHTIIARATNGVDTHELEAQITATGGSPPKQPHIGGDFDPGALLVGGVAVAVVGALGAAWYVLRQRKSR